MSGHAEMKETRNDAMETQQTVQPVDGEEIEGLAATGESWGDYPIDDLLIRHESRTIHDVIRRIDQKNYVMDPDFQRDFIWPEDKQSKLIESVVMRIPLPVFYMAEDDEGRMVVVDGLQRLSTFQRFVKGELRLRLPGRGELDGRCFADLSSKLQNRIEDCNLIFYIIDSKVPERARLDIFERVNGGVPLTRQQMRNCLFMGKSTQFLKTEARTELFVRATGRSLNARTMRDREFVNRFSAFQLIEIAEYRGDMDDFLAKGLRRMKQARHSRIVDIVGGISPGVSPTTSCCSIGMRFRKHTPGQERRGVLNASFWDVMSTGLSRYTERQVSLCAGRLRRAVHELFEDPDFNTAITYGPNGAGRVKYRFEMSRRMFEETLGACTH